MKIEKRLICVMCGGLLFGLTCYAQDQIITFSTAKPSGENVKFTVNNPTDTVRVDWGDGQDVPYVGTEALLPIEGKLKGQTITLKASKYLTTFICEGQRLTTLSLKDAKWLRSLYCPNNELTSVSLMDNPEIVDVDLSHNKLTRLVISASNNSNLENINVASNKLKGIGQTFGLALSKQSLQTINISDNDFTTAYVGDYTHLDVFNAANNKIKFMNLSNTPSLSTIVVNDNGVSNFTLPATTENKALVQLVADNNSLKTLDLTRYPQLKDLSVSNAELTEIKLPRTKLYSLNCGGNMLSFRSLPVKAYQPSTDQLTCSPQGPIDLKSKLKQKQGEEGAYYVEQCPSYDDKDNYLYKTDFSDLRKNGNNIGTVKVEWYSLDDGGVPRKLELASTSNKNGDYVDSYGKTVFLKPLHKVYAVLTDPTNYPNLELKTMVFAVGENQATGIEAIQTTNNVSNSRIYDLNGREVMKPVSGQIYIINGKKVFFK